MSHKIIGVVMCTLLITNASVVLGNTSEVPCGTGAGMGPNLAPNPSFEEGETMPTGWTYDPNTNGTYTWDSSYAFSGEKSVGVLNLTDDGYPPHLLWMTTDFIPVDCAVNSYRFSAWFKFVDIPPVHQYANIHIQKYDINFQPTGSSGAGYGSDDVEWHQIDTQTGYSDDVKYVKLEIGQEFSMWGDPDPLVEVRFDDVYFDIYNTAPDTPTITGETHGKVRILYEYTITTIDPDQDNVTYEIDWGDNTTQITDVYESGEEIIISHIWGIERTYTVRVRAIDEDNAKSDWANLTVTMPCSHTIPFIQFWMRLLECFSNMFPVLRHLFRE